MIDFPEHSKKEDICAFLGLIRKNNPRKKIIIILDNFSSHKAEDTMKHARKNNMKLILLPPYSPDLNPIEYIWKSIKRIISKNFIVDKNHMMELIRINFLKFAKKLSFALAWIGKFIDEPYKYQLLGA